MARRTAQSAGKFDGFPRDLVDFLKELAANNRKDWFEDHRAEYEELYAEPAKAFAAAITPPLARLVPDVRGQAQRIYRDTRFSKDKTPYKTALLFGFSRAKGEPGFHLRIAPDGLGIAAGIFGMSSSQLVRYREALVDAKRGAALGRVIAKVEKAGPYRLSEPHYKRVPKGFDPDHPRAHLLRQRTLFIGGEHPLSKELFGSGAVGFCLDRFREVAPVQAWLAEALA